jgi:uncharacterized protein (DUF1786 family)
MQILALDIGTSMQDILLFDSERGTVKMTIPSPTMLVARAIQAATRRGDDLFLTGVTMGGGPCTQAARLHIDTGYRMFATPEVAHTFADDIEGVTKMGIQIVSESEHPARAVRLEMRDLDFATIVRTFMSFGVQIDPDALAVAVFDHGIALAGDGETIHRSAHLYQCVRARPDLTALAHTRSNIPTNMLRMRAVAASAPPALPLIVMDPAFAALLGAQQDATVQRHDTLLLAHLGTIHTLAVHIHHNRIAGLFEHHTSELSPEKLEQMLTALAEGTIADKQALCNQTHGAVVLDPISDRMPFLALTGTKYNLVCGLRYKPHFATPHGDAHGAGCWGLLHAYAALHPESASQINAALASPSQVLLYD